MLQEDRTDRHYGRGGVLLEADGARYAYDARGNVIEKRLPDGRAWTYAWNGRGFLASVTTPENREITFEYDALGRRVSKTVAAKTTRWQWDGNVPVHEWTSEGEHTTWVFEPGTLTPSAKLAHDKRCYSVVGDYLGTPEEMFDEAGELAWRAQLDIYGVAQIEQGTAADCPFRWQGQYEDVETGLYYNRFRYYDPGRGDYLSQHPIALLGLDPGATLYSYTRDPLVLPDPFGLAVPFQIGTYGSLNSPSDVGDALGAHEMIRHAYLQALGKAGDARLSANPSIALSQAMHNSVHAEEAAVRASMGLGKNQFSGSLKGELDIMEKAMLRAGVPPSKIAELRENSEEFGKGKGCK